MRNTGGSGGIGLFSLLACHAASAHPTRAITIVAIRTQSASFFGSSGMLSPKSLFKKFKACLEACRVLVAAASKRSRNFRDIDSVLRV